MCVSPSAVFFPSSSGGKHNDDDLHYLSLDMGAPKSKNLTTSALERLLSSYRPTQRRRYLLKNPCKGMDGLSKAAFVAE